MSNGRINFSVPSGDYTLHFGMKSAQIYAEKGVQEYLKMQERGETEADNIKSFAYIIYAGLSNYADIAEKNSPSFEEAYLITEEILLEGEKLQNDIFDVWRNSRPTVQLMERLGLNADHSGDDKKKAGTTGTK